MVLSYSGRRTRIGKDVFIAPTAVVIETAEQRRLRQPRATYAALARAHRSLSAPRPRRRT